MPAVLPLFGWSSRGAGVASQPASNVFFPETLPGGVQGGVRAGDGHKFAVHCKGRFKKELVPGVCVCVRALVRAADRDGPAVNYAPRPLSVSLASVRRRRTPQKKTT